MPRFFSSVWQQREREREREGERGWETRRKWPKIAADATNGRVYGDATNRIHVCNTRATNGKRFPGKTREIGQPCNNCDNCARSNHRGIRLTILQHWLLVLWISNCPASRHSLPAFSQQHAIVRDQFHRGPKNFMLTISLERQTSFSNELRFPSSRERGEDFLRPILGSARSIYNSRYRHWIDGGEEQHRRFYVNRFL